jgi:hypothetical protein
VSRPRLLLALAALLLGPALVPAPATAQPSPPLAATIAFDGPPANLTFDETTPIKIVLQLRNVSGAPIIAPAGFSTTEFWRQLYFVLDGVGVIGDTTEALRHADSPFGTCHYRGSVVLPGAGIQVLAVEVVPPDFALQFTFDDARTHFDLSRAGRYAVTARISILTYTAGDIIRDCNIEFNGQELLSIGADGTGGRQQFDIASNSLEFFVRPTDVTAPTTTVVPLPAANAAGWNNQDVTLSLDAADDPGGSGVKDIVVTLFGAQSGTQTISGASGSVSVSAEGTTTIFYNAEDNAGNQETVGTQTVRLDKMPPAVTPPASINVAPTEAGGSRGSASPALAAFLAGGTALDSLDPSPVRLPTQTGGANVDNNTLFPPGSTTVTFRFQDVAGNVGRANASVTVGEAAEDRTAPTTTATPTAGPQSVTVTLTAQDNPGGSGVQQITYSLSGAQSGGATVPASSTSVVISAHGATTLSYFATDKAGNQEAAKTLTVQIGAGNTSCTGSMTGTFQSVDVPDGASCALVGAFARGNVQVKGNASLTVGPPGASTIRGNVHADGCVSLTLSGAVTVGGNVKIQRCAADSGYTGPGVRIDGNFQCHDNLGACVARNGAVGGNLQVNDNTSSSPSDISGNTIGGNLQCQGNVPAPTHTGSNTARNKQGQCAASLGF